MNEINSFDLNSTQIDVIKAAVPQWLWTPEYECPNLVYQRLLEKGLEQGQANEICQSVAELVKRHCRDRVSGGGKELGGEEGGKKKEKEGLKDLGCKEILNFKQTEIKQTRSY